jgi:hypothetical protein
VPAALGPDAAILPTFVKFFIEVLRLEDNLAQRMALFMKDVEKAPWSCFGTQARTTTVGRRRVWVVPLIGMRQGVEDTSGNYEVRRVQGMHCSTVSGAQGILKNGFLRGSEDLPGSYFKGSVDGGIGDLNTGLTLYSGCVDSNKNAAGLIFELTCRREFFNYDAWKATRRENDLGGTYWDTWIAMERQGIAHYKSGKENRYCVSGVNATLVQLWIQDDALTQWNRWT